MWAGGTAVAQPIQEAEFLAALGVGVHRGEAIIGTLGSPRRLDYSAIGDTVNVAARIESENKAAGTEILISGEVYRALPADERRGLAVAEESFSVQVKGVERPIQLHRVDVPDPEIPVR
jgi:adenylate cyclase